MPPRYVKLGVVYATSAVGNAGKGRVSSLSLQTNSFVPPKHLHSEGLKTLVSVTGEKTLEKRTGFLSDKDPEAGCGELNCLFIAICSDKLREERVPSSIYPLLKRVFIGMRSTQSRSALCSVWLRRGR